MLRVAALAGWGQTGKGQGFLLYPALPGALMVSESPMALLTLQPLAPA